MQKLLLMMTLNVLVPHSVVSSTGPIRGSCKSLSQSVVRVLHLNTKYISDSLKPFLLNGIPLPVHQSVRDLGVIVNDSLTPSSHIATRSSADADNRLDAFTITGAPVNTTVTYNEAIFVTEH